MTAFKMFPTLGGKRPLRGGGFTMIELMVVLAIIMIAAGLMTPTLHEFFSNRKLDGVRGEFGTVFSRARLNAVTKGRDVSVVFFQEGGRIFDELSGRFIDEEVWAPNSTALSGASGAVWYLLGFARNKSSFDLAFWNPMSANEPSQPNIPPFQVWAAGRPSNPTASAARRINITGLFKVTFHRDGTLSFGPGSSDMPSALFNVAGTADDGDPPTGRGDVMIFQQGNSSACYIDLRPTGQARSKIVVWPEAITALNPFDRQER